MKTSKVWKGQKVILREKSLADAADDYRWRSDEELARLDAAPPLRMPFQDFLRLYEEELRYPYPWSRRFAIDTLDGKHIGNCMYYDIDYTTGEAELGIMIGEKEYWNRGYGTDAVKTLLAMIFTETTLQRIYLHTLEWNVRAQRSFAKAGFVPVRTVRRNGQVFLRMEISREHWLRLQREEQAQQVPSTPPQG
ncbi:MAG: GNAT family N-acetyltransferase [Dehalococcoidia bacterium]|nr:GNAT family N-acetyltransferase [Dehalococcoidia bacterium]MDW8120494.1 GNAT family N-acetyltransferase [Chloroflexota bacterium]